MGTLPNLEEIYSFAEALEHLTIMAWTFMEYQAKEELVMDQFLNGMDSHELGGGQWVPPPKGRAMCSMVLSMVDEEEKYHSHRRKSTT